MPSLKPLVFECAMRPPHQVYMTRSITASPAAQRRDSRRCATYRFGAAWGPMEVLCRRVTALLPAQEDAHALQYLAPAPAGALRRSEHDLDDRNGLAQIE